jgi:hypothetical protein
MPEILVDLIEKQTAILFLNLDSTLKGLSPEQLAAPGSWGWPLDQQVCHLLRSLDQWFIDPFNYTTARPGTPGPGLAAPELGRYYLEVKTKIASYLSELQDSQLAECPPGSRFTRLELILGQYRHWMYHIGLIHGCLRSVNGHNPEYHGLGPSPPARPQ